MKKLFISQPMRGKTDEEILKERKSLIADVYMKSHDEIKVIDSFFESAPADATPLWYLGESLKLLGTGAAGRCKIPASWAAGDSFTVNDAAVPAYCGADAVDGDTIVKGRWVLFFYDGTQLNFNGGGGFSTSKLALATATEGNVLAGNKFYAGSKTIKEGTLTLTGNVTADKMLEGSSGYADDAHSIVAGHMPNRGSWGATLSPGGVATVPSGYHNGSGLVAAVSLKTVTITMATSYGDWVYTLPSGTLVGVSNIAASGESPEIASLTISGNTVRVTWSDNGVINRQITLIYY